MDTETISVIKDLFQEYASKDSGTVTATYLTVGGMFGVALLGAISQWVITKRVASEEREKMLSQVSSERYARQHEKWEENIIEGATGLLKATDPEINSNINPAAVDGYALRIQLLLNTNDPNKNRVNQLVNQLALTANGWQPSESASALLSIHAQLIESTKLLIYRPMNNV